MKKFIAIVMMTVLLYGTVSVQADDDLTPKEQIIKQILSSNYNYTSTGFFEAIKDGNTECVDLFLKSGMEPTTTNMKLPAIYFAIAKKQPKVVEQLLKAGVSPNTDFQGRSPLNAAIASKNPETVKILIWNGARVNEESWGITPLNYALKKKNAEMVTSLINAGAYVDEESLKRALNSNNDSIKNAVLTKYKNNRSKKYERLYIL